MAYPRIARISNQRRKAPGDADRPFDAAQQQNATIRAHASAVQCGDDFLAFDGWCAFRSIVITDSV
jgi:hypothetical protein